jgi:stress-induced morphogen
MMDRQSRMKKALEGAFGSEHLVIEDESHQHSGPRSETHFKVLIVSELFSGKSRMERQRAVYECLKSELESGLHALTLKTLTPMEWNDQKESLQFKSPECRGGSHVKK